MMRAVPARCSSWARDAKPQGVPGVHAGREGLGGRPPAPGRLAADGHGPRTDDGLPPERRAGVLSVLDTQKRLGPGGARQAGQLRQGPAAPARRAGLPPAPSRRVMTRDFKQTGHARSVPGQAAHHRHRVAGRADPLPGADDAHARGARAGLGGHRALREDPRHRGQRGRPGRGGAQPLRCPRTRRRCWSCSPRRSRPSTSVCVRWALFRFAARVAGKDALPVMANMAVIDPRFQPHLPRLRAALRQRHPRLHPAVEQPAQPGPLRLPRQAPLSTGTAMTRPFRTPVSSLGLLALALCHLLPQPGGRAGRLGPGPRARGRELLGRRG